MIVRDLKEILKNYNDDAEVVVVDFSNGETREAFVGSDDEDEGEQYCRISC